MSATDKLSAKPSGFTVIRNLALRMVASRRDMRGDVAKGTVLELAGIVMGITGPYALKLLVDALTREEEGWPYLLMLVAVFVVTWAGVNVLSVWRMVYSTRVIDRLTERLVSEALQGALPAAVTVKDGDSGRTAGRLERLPYSLMVVVDGLIWRAAPLLLQVLGSLWLIAGLIPLRYAVIMAVVLTGYVFATWFGAVFHQRFAGVANLATSNLSRNLADILRNARRVVLNGAIDLEVDRVKAHFAEKRQANTRMMWALVLMSFCQYGGVGAGLLLLLVLGCGDVLSHTMTVGDFVLLQAYAFRLASPLSGFGFILSQCAVSIANISDVMEMAAVDEAHEAKTVSPQTGAATVTLSGVSFSYGPGRPRLCDIIVDIPAGSFTVIVGPNGSGKSTLAQLMAGILEPTAGGVWIGGEDLSHVPPRERHSRILYVPQTPGLFSRSLLSNALYPPTSQTEHGLLKLLAQWNFHEAGRPIDLRLEVGEQGERLSGGQVQKLELARVAGMNLPAIILDESTAALDPASEAQVINSLRSGFDGKTTLILISHREPIAAAADQVLFVKAGRIARQGTHDRLLQDSAAYRRLWRK